MNKYDYEELLNRSIKSLPEKLTSRERFQIPHGVIFYEGNTTVLKNFADIAGDINRDEQHLLSYLLKELGTAGEAEGERAVFQGKIPEEKVQERIQDYVQRYVLCRECNRPDTKMIKKNRTLLLKCEACGAVHPVKARKTKRD
ncbi:MAG TPA: translation initiation factor IF-2 subunit beta [Thermoplasmatales archaeon]|nr:translation initiation factor IF-2 subunit beta [Candidatus Thermoplasmatota archaeon]MDD5777864.1 translation initiation factor IF-2 subunit beta [Candidatus Thermoplasmatota archaeon]HDS58797.1 translation initiation factor IF-2 subunit beta [Thermoplasmatales archaeon]